MIISVSRRTDIPAFYSEWFFERVKAGFVLVRNPMNYRQVSQVSLHPGVVDGMVLWSKNPAPMLQKLDMLKDYPYYFQFTLNPYDSAIEPGLPAKSTLIQTFIRLAEKIGKGRVIWRYDPILFTSLGIPLDKTWHEEQFEAIAQQLAPYTELCIISFLNCYPKIQTKLRSMQVREIETAEKIALACGLERIAGRYGLTLEACAEGPDLAGAGIRPARCINGERFIRDWGGLRDIPKDKNQRAECGCVESIDIGAYNTCPHGCIYCYANQNKIKPAADARLPMLGSRLEPEDKVVLRKMKSYREQGSLFPID